MYFPYQPWIDKPNFTFVRSTDWPFRRYDVWHKRESGEATWAVLRNGMGRDDYHYGWLVKDEGEVTT